MVCCVSPAGFKGNLSLQDIFFTSGLQQMEDAVDEICTLHPPEVTLPAAAPAIPEPQLRQAGCTLLAQAYGGLFSTWWFPFMRFPRSKVVSSWFSGNYH